MAPRVQMGWSWEKGWQYQYQELKKGSWRRNRSGNGMQSEFGLKLELST